MNLKTRQLIAGIAIVLYAMYPNADPPSGETWFIFVVILLTALLQVGLFLLGFHFILESLREDECECDDMDEEEFFDHMKKIENGEEIL